MRRSSPFPSSPGAEYGDLGYRRSFMRLTAIAARLARDPRGAAEHMMARLRFEHYWDEFRRRCEKSVKGPCFLLSFDCDTDRDRVVVASVHQRVSELGAKPAYAIPGELLHRGGREYQSIREQGAIFINHGYAEHSKFDAASGGYLSTLDYGRLSRSKVAEDVQKGHQSIKEVLGIQPTGFRSPHFGGFQRREQLQFLHGILKRLEYRWSSSTTPKYGFAKGPAFQDFGIWELPVTGCHRRPLAVLDSYSFRFTPDRRVGEEEFLNEARWLATELGRGHPFVVNIYADPSQVHDWEGFFEAVRLLAPWSVSFDALVDDVSSRRPSGTVS